MRFMKGVRTYALLFLASVAAAAVACTSSSSSSETPGTGNDAGSDPSTDPGASDSGDAGTTAPAAEPLSATTFAYVRRVANDHDELVAHDLATGSERTITDLREGETYSSVAGFSISPDRRSIAVATSYGAEAADLFAVARRVFKLGVDGKGFVRLTPPFKNNGGGSPSYFIDVRDPVFSKDGATVFYTFGESNRGFGGTRTWSVSAAGGSLPALVESSFACSDIGQASVGANGGLVLVHSTCQNAADEGFFAYPATGAPAKVFGPENATVVSPVSWAPDGSGFLVALRNVNGVGSLHFFDGETGTAPMLVQGTRNVAYVRSATMLADGKIVYCVQSGTGATDLRLLDGTVTPPTDTALTTDGKSCDPRY